MVLDANRSFFPKINFLFLIEITENIFQKYRTEKNVLCLFKHKAKHVMYKLDYVRLKGLLDLCTIIIQNKKLKFKS